MLTPVQHRRASTWLAMDAINNDDIVAADIIAEGLFENDPFATRVNGWIEMRSGNLAEALVAWQSIEDYRTLLDAATHLEQMGQPGNADKTLRVAQAINPRHGIQAQVDFLLRQNAPDAAIAVLTTTIEAYPHADGDRTGWLKQLGDLQKKNGRWLEAEETYQQLAESDPVEGNIRLGWLAYEGEQGVEIALTYFGKAERADLIGGKGYYNQASLLAREKRVDEADSLFLQAIQERPTEESWQRAYANHARRTDNLDEAVRRYSTAIQNFPDSASLYFELAEVYRLAGYETAAIDTILVAITLAETPNISYYLRAAAIYESASQTESAIEFYKQALALDEQDRTATAALERLQDTQ